MQVPHLFSVTAISLLVAGSAHATTTYAVENNYARNGSGVQNPSSGLVVKNAGASTSTRASFIKFDLTGLDADTSAGATVTFSFLSGTDTTAIEFEAFALDAGYVSPGGGILGTDWTGDELEYANVPGWQNITSGGIFISSADYTSIGTQTITPNNTAPGTALSFSLTQLSDFMQADNTVTFAFFSNTSTSPLATFSSIENGTAVGDLGTAPRLTYTQVPEPATYAGLFGLGVLGLAIWRRR